MKALINVLRSDLLALSQHALPSRSGPALLVVAADAPGGASGQWGGTQGAGLEARTIPGDRLGLMTEPHVELVAAAVDHWLDDVRRQAHSAGRGTVAEGGSDVA